MAFDEMPIHKKNLNKRIFKHGLNGSFGIFLPFFILEADLIFVLCNLEFHTILKTTFLNKVKKGDSHTVHEFSSGYWEIKFGHDSDNQQDDTVYFPNSWDKVIFNESFREKIDRKNNPNTH